MQKIIYCFICLMGIFFNRGHAQQSETVQIIVTRHAEKEPGDNADPDLSAAGKQRAGRLAAMLQDTKVDELYVTPYKRTAQTLAPLAVARQLKAEQYNPGKLQDFAHALQAKKGKTVVVAGHANTAPELVNLLIGENKYTILPETEFGKVWILTLTNGKATSCLLVNIN
jgi:2,3-bisphosphoglycerate-dependent phosphoglycerate mutase